MRRSILGGLLLALAAALVVWLSAALDLELESAVLFGAAVGAVLAMVPDRTPAMRFVGFAGGFVIAWIGFFVRAALVPDTASGRAVVVGLVLLACVGLVAATMGRLPMWSTLLGAAAMAGGYEYTYAAAPPEVVSTSVTTATSLLVCIAVGFLVAAATAPADAVGEVAPRQPRANDHGNSKLDDLMTENAK